MIQCRRRFTAAATVLFAVHAQAQCEPQWLPGPGYPGTNGEISAAVMWDPDGPGPSGRKVVVAGSFTIAGSVLAKNIAVFDPETQKFSSLGIEEFDNHVSALLALPNGHLVAGGYFTKAGGVTLNRIAIWDGTRWNALGTGMQDPQYTPYVDALAILPNGDIVAAGSFRSAGGTDANRIASWDGANWHPLGSGFDSSVFDLIVMNNGDLVAGGAFGKAGNTVVNRIASWDGAQWKPLGSGMSGIDYVRVAALTKLPSGDIVAGGGFSSAGGAQVGNVARWDGTKWIAVGSGLREGAVYSLAQRANGEIVAGGDFRSTTSGSAVSIARWDGTRWLPFGSGLFGMPTSSSPIAAANAVIELESGQLLAAGRFLKAGLIPAENIALWKNETWQSVPYGIARSLEAAGVIYAMAPLGDTVFLGGQFSHVNGISANSIALRDGIGLKPLSTGIGYPPGSPYSSVNAVSLQLNGNPIIAGDFRSPGNISTVARWDGQSWLPMGSGVTDNWGTSATVHAIIITPSGDAVVGGFFAKAGGQNANNVAMWKNDAWHPLGEGLRTGVVYALALLPNGNVVAGGKFQIGASSATYHVAEWNGILWKSLDSEMDGTVFALAALPTGHVIAGGEFTTVGGVSSVGRIARWTGTTWQRMGVGGLNDNVYALAALPNGHVVAGGKFTTAGGVGSPANRIASWDGARWSPLGVGIGIAGEEVRSLAALPSGDIAAGGKFSRSGGKVSMAYARWTSRLWPLVAEAPRPQTVIAGQELLLTATAASDYAGVSYEWELRAAPYTAEYANILNGAAGASDNGGTVSGASGQLPSPTDGTPATLTITNIQHSDSGMYRVTFWNSCGEATSIPVEVKVKAHITDINADGQVDDADFILFSAQYDLMLCADTLMPDACSADFNQDGQVDDADFVIFVPAYHAMLFR